MSKQVFAMFDVNNRARVQKRLEESFPDDFLPVGSQAFLVAASGITTRQLADRLGLSTPNSLQPSQTGIVVPVTTYWGLHNTDVWEWIAAKTQANG